MITKKTVFILGAGASKPFEFPLGSELRDRILNLIGPHTENSKTPRPLEIFEQGGHTYPELLLFRDTFLKSQKKSIDAFLEHRPEYMKLGKLLIALNLIKFEKLETIYSNPNWYGYLWDRLNTNFETFGENNISFITFNYDRSLETYLLNSMMALFNKTEDECYEKLLTIPIIHVHGTIGKNKYQDPKNYTPFGQAINDYSQLLHASNTIKIIHEDISNDKEFEIAHSLINNSEKTIILGLGYDETNLTRLKINESKYSMIGSAFGLTPMECTAINNKFPIITFSQNTDHEALNFLRHSVILE